MVAGYIAGAGLAALIAIACFVVFWLRGGRDWLVGVGIAHALISAGYVYLVFVPPDVMFRRALADDWTALLVPLSTIAANGFAFWGVLRLLGRDPRTRLLSAAYGGFGAAVVALYFAYAPVPALVLVMIVISALASFLGIVMIVQRSLFYVIVGVFTLARVAFSLTASLFVLNHGDIETVGVLTLVNLVSLVGDGFGYIMIEYDDTRRQLAEADRGKSAFLASISHELRTPLNAIIGFAELIGRRSTGAPATANEDYASDIAASGRRLLGVVDQILDIVQIEAKRFKLDLQRVDVAEIVHDTLRTFRSQAEQKQIRTQIETPSAAVETLADQRALAKIVSNLIDNAIKFSPAGSRVEISLTTTAARTVRLIVADQGRGIPADRLGSLFTPFAYAADAYTRGDSGIGLGLAISSKLVEAMGGKVFVDSALGRGSTFTVLLPAAP